MGVVPFMYPYGFCCSVLVTIFIGGEALLAPDINSDNVAEYYAKKQYLIFGSSAFLELSKRNIPNDLKLPTLKLFVSGGDFLSVSQSKEGIDFFTKHGATVEICNGSGNGETLGCGTNSMDIPYRPETVGQLVVGPDYVIIDPETKEEVKYGEPGILCISGKHVFKGYFISHVADNTKPVGKDGELIGIAEMLVDVHLSGIGAGGGMGRHKPISHGVWIDFGLVLVKSFEFSDEGIEGFGVVFVDVKLNTGGVKGEGLCQFGIDQLADGFRIIHHLLKQEFNIRLKVLFETGQERGIRDLGKTAEIPDFSG